ncbi:putative phage-like protein [Sinorhizobium meliloti CCNWSX0020]|uniref:Putative phage-like protein n=1 Tax=Sinorhizobium meliloti CCNWSX0020 TaxID=1107881 RepID=H0FXY9_RHIML|nr:hypothetical protein [Sinorhizobium meliloti]EHK78061.1 putative phage-like protein [Sinorhizobium meliloti CCNWSX0020]
MSTGKDEKSRADWEAIEREYRAGQISLRAIATAHGITEGAIRKRAKAEGWQRALAEKVRQAVREKLVRTDGTQDGTQPQRASDSEIIEGAALRGLNIVTSHRKDLQQLHGLKRVLAERLSTYMQGVAPDGPCLGDKESPGDLLEKLSRITARLIPLERQAHNLDAEPDEPSGGRSLADFYGGSEG